MLLYHPDADISLVTIFSKLCTTIMSDIVLRGRHIATLCEEGSGKTVRTNIAVHAKDVCYVPLHSSNTSTYGSLHIATV